MLTAVVFIIILGLLIFVHELGHFLVARKNGITAYEFGFGFPPRILGFQLLKGEKVKKWRFIRGKRDTDKEWKTEPDLKEGTIYSINWIPLGGFVKIKGEDGSRANDPDSFAARSAWIRIKVLFAGVAMNFVLAWVLITLALMIGAPEAVDGANKKIRDAKIQISQVISDSPADSMGIKAGDEIIRCNIEDNRCRKNFEDVSQIQNFINDHNGQEIILQVKRGKDLIDLKGVPRTDYPEGQGALGISLVKTAIVEYPWYEAIIKGFTSTINVIILIITTLFDLLKNLIIGEKVMVDVSGPVGIAYLTKQVTQLGLVYILQFAALLSINLGIINGLPIPALDGGRILFIIIEKIKGSPVSHKVENFAHTVGFVLLIILMILVTLRDVLKLEVVSKIGNIF